MRASDVRRDIARAIEDVDEVRALLDEELNRPQPEEFVAERYVNKVQRATKACYELRNDLRDLLG